MAKTVRQLTEEWNELVDEATAMQNVVARDQNGEWTADQRERWDELCAGADKKDDEPLTEDDGLIRKKRFEVNDAKVMEAEVASLQSMRRLMTDPSERFYSSPEAPKPKANVISRIGRLKAFAGDKAEQNAYDCGMWLRALIAKARNERDERAEQKIKHLGWSIWSAHTEGDPTKGGYTVPDPLASAIINYRELSGISRQISRVLPMTADTLDIPKKTGSTTVYYPGEASAITESEQTFGRVQLTAKKRAVLSKISQELSDDAIINIIDDLAMEIGSDLAIQEDNELVNGDGTSTYGGVTGLLSAIGSAGVQDADTGEDTWDELDIQDFTAMMSKLPAKHRAAGPVFLCAPSFYDSVIMKLMATAGVNTIQQFEQGGAGAGRGVGPGGRFLGYPVYFTDQMPTATAASTVSCLFGAFQRAVMIGDRLGVRIALSPDFAFNEDVITVRATTRYDIVVHEPGTASAAGAYVALKTAS